MAKRNLKLCLELLQAIENDDEIKINDENRYHLLLLQDAGFVKLTESHLKWLQDKAELAGKPMPNIYRLTWAGHNVLSRTGSHGPIAYREDRNYWVWGL